MDRVDRGYIQVFVTPSGNLGLVPGRWVVRIKIHRMGTHSLLRCERKSTAERSARRLRKRLLEDAVLPIQVEDGR